MTGATDRRARRAASQDLFNMLAAEYEARSGVSRDAMFGSLGLQYSGKFFAFVGSRGQLVLKLPAERAAALVNAGTASVVRAGRNPTREWVGVPPPHDPADAGAWRTLLAEAYRYALDG